MAFPAHNNLKCCCFVLIFVLSLFLTSCAEDPPVKIGFLGGISGRVADLGVAGRDAVMLAVEEKNKTGGINGRRIELVVQDDQQDGEAALRSVQALVDEKVVGIIGPMTSSMAVKVQPVVNANKVVMISPTVKTDQLSNQDDYFLRVTVPLSSNARKMAEYVVRKRGLKRFGVVYDLSNKAFTETWLMSFRDAFEKEGGQVIFSESFTSQQATRFLPVAKRLVEADVEGVLLLSSAIDTALMAQQIRKLESPIELFCSEWAFTADLLSFGGRAVEGMTSYHSFNADGQEPAYLAFKETFKKRYGEAPSFANVLAYDATILLFAGLERQTSQDSLKTSLLEVDKFPGLQSFIKLNKFGDVERKLFLTVVKNGHFQVRE